MPTGRREKPRAPRDDRGRAESDGNGTEYPLLKERGHCQRQRVALDRGRDQRPSEHSTRCPHVLPSTDRGRGVVVVVRGDGVLFELGEVPRLLHNVVGPVGLGIGHHKTVARALLVRGKLE